MTSLVEERRGAYDLLSSYRVVSPPFNGRIEGGPSFLLPRLSKNDVNRLWLHRQGFSQPRATVEASKEALTRHLERTGALQLDTINVIDRAHYLTLWSRFGVYDRSELDGWIYRDRAAYEYWGHEASILPMAHLATSRRRMSRFPPRHWKRRAYWKHYQTSLASRRRVLRRLRHEGPLESVDFKRTDESGDLPPLGGAMPMPKEDSRSLKLLWHEGRVAISRRRHFRCVYDLAERVYPTTDTVSTAEYQDSWLLKGLSGNGVASEAHLVNYMTAPQPTAKGRSAIIARNLKTKRIRQVSVEGIEGLFYVRPEHLDVLESIPRPRGTTLICPFDSLLWQRRRAEELLDFSYRIEIYVPPAKRVFGYYVLPILHDGRLVGRLDPKFHRDRSCLEIKSLALEPDFKPNGRFEKGLADSLRSLARFLGATDLQLPGPWRRLL